MHNQSVSYAYKIRKPDGASKHGAGRNKMRSVKTCGDDKGQQAVNGKWVESGCCHVDQMGSLLHDSTMTLYDCDL